MAARPEEALVKAANAVAVVGAFSECLKLVASLPAGFETSK